MRFLARILTAILLGLLFKLLGLAAAAAENRVAEPASTPRLRFDQTLAAASWTGGLPWSDTQFRFWPSVEAGADRAGGNDRWRIPPAASPDWPGIRQDTGYFLGYQFVAVGILYVAPESVSRWSEEDKRNLSLSQWMRNVGDPIWDDDA